MHRLVVALSFLDCTSWVAQTQIQHIDSLKQLVYHASNDREKLSAIFVLCDEYLSLNRDTFDLYPDEVKALAKKSGNERNISLAAIVTANNCYRWGCMDSAMADIEPVMKQSPVEKTEYRDLYFKAGRQKALFFGSKSKYAEALEMFYQLVSNGEKYHDTLAISSYQNPEVLSKSEDNQYNS